MDEFKCIKCGKINRDYISFETIDDIMYRQSMGGGNICGKEGCTPLNYSDCKKCGCSEFVLVNEKENKSLTEFKELEVDE